MKKLLLALVITLALPGCFHSKIRTTSTPSLATLWPALSLKVPPFTLYAKLKPHAQGHSLHVYVEGDGRAWLNSRTVSPDPTPNDPVALRLATQDPSDNVAYLARPCQYIASKACHYRYWTYARFAPEVVKSLNDAVDQLKNKTGAQRIDLIGFSGGGGLVLLMAAKRADVDRVISVAGNVSTDAWTRYHHITPLKRSLNPVQALPEISQNTRLCFIYGDHDRVFPLPLVLQIKHEINNLRPDSLFILEKGVGHRWPTVGVYQLCRFSQEHPSSARRG